MIRTYEESSNESDKEHIFAMKDTNNNDSFPYEKSMRYYCLFLYEIMIKNLNNRSSKKRKRTRERENREDEIINEIIQENFLGYLLSQSMK